MITVLRAGIVPAEAAAPVAIDVAVTVSDCPSLTAAAACGLSSVRSKRRPEADVHDRLAEQFVARADGHQVNRQVGDADRHPSVRTVPGGPSARFGCGPLISTKALTS